MKVWFREVAVESVIRATLLACLVTALGLVQAGAASQTGGFGGRPGNPDPDNPRTGSIFIHTVKAGMQTTDQLLVSNNSLDTVTLSFNAVDGIVTNTGAYTCRQNSEARTDVGSWIRLSATEITLKPDEKKLIDFTINVPASADVGEHNGCIVFQDTDDQGKKIDGGAVTVRTRQAVRLVVTVPGDLRRDISIDRFSYSHDAGSRIYALSVKNQGNVSADVDMRVEMTDLFGRTYFTNGGAYPVLRDQVLTETYVDKSQIFFGGWYKVRASIAYDKRAGTFGTTNTAELIRSETPVQVVFLWPSLGGWLVILPIIGIIAAIVWWCLIKRQEKRYVKNSWKEVELSDAMTIDELARHYGISWKMLARVNKLKPPYTITRGDTLLLPTLSDDKELQRKSE